MKNRLGKLVLYALISVLVFRSLVFAYDSVIEAQEPIEILQAYPSVIPVEVRSGVYQNFCYDDCGAILTLNGVEFMEVEYSTFNEAWCGYSIWFYEQDLNVILQYPPTQPVNIVGCD